MVRLNKTDWRENYYLKALLYGMAVSFIFFIPFILFDNGYFLFYGDFNVQQVPFYQMCHDAVRSGNIWWSWTTDLGANFIGSYSFYLLGSPFFWLTIPFPSWMVPHLMGPLLILKFGCASLTGFIYLKRYVRNPKYAIIGGMLYAFSGFSVYNIFFNHFHEAIVFFPLMLAAMDEYMYKRRRGVFALSVFACCFVNYYFFVGQVTFCIIYWIVRMVCGSWRISLKDFAWLALEAVLGVLMACVLLIPTVLAVSQNPRINNPPEGWGALLYGWNQRYVHILECFFFPPDIPARPNFTPDSEAKWASLGAWLPLFSMTGVLAFLQAHRKHWLKYMLGILFLMAAVPVLNSAFQLFNSSYYARWYYMLTLMMCLATLSSLEYDKTDWKRAIKWTLGITIGIALPIGLMPNTTNSSGVKKTTYGLEAYPTRFWTYVAIAMLSLLLLVIIFRHFKKNKAAFIRYAMFGIGLITVVYAAFFIALGKTQSEDTHQQLIPYSLNNGKDIHLPDLQNCRSDFYNGMDNQAMYWQIPTIQAFHSIVPGSIMDFYPTIGVTRDVGSRPDVKNYGLRGLTSCRWLFDYAYDDKSFGDDDITHQNPKMPGWSYFGKQNGFYVWKNDYYIPMGFCYDSYITQKQYNDTNQSNRDLLLLKAVVLDDKQIEKYSDILQPIEDSTGLSFTNNDYFTDCLTRQSMACSSFSHDNNGFTASIKTTKDRLVFFSVPYEKGWSATVNGQKADVEKVSIGFMAVRVPAGSNTIRFTYQTPGISVGLAVTIGGILLFIGYLYLITRLDKKRRKAAVRRTYYVLQHLPSGDEFRKISKNRHITINSKFHNEEKPTEE